MDLKKLGEAATEQFSKHGLVGWTFRLADTKRRLGVCKHRTKRIEISEYYAIHNSVDAVLDTLLHEIAHAIAGPKAGHGPLWKKSRFASVQRHEPVTIRQRHYRSTRRLADHLHGL
jgi:hypothetical protein